MADIQNQRPQKDFNTITQTALKAHALYIKHAALLQERVEAGVIDSMVLDLDSLGVLVPGAKTKREVSKTATSTQDEALKKGYDLLSAARTNVTRRKPPEDVRKAYGVGRRLSPKLVKDVVGGLGQIVKRATEKPDEAKSMGILPRDVDGFNKAIEEINKADKKQEQLRAGFPTTTKERNRTARRILEAINTIIGAGVMEFAQKPTDRSEFEALIGQGNPKPKTEEEKAARKAEQERKKAEKLAAKEAKEKKQLPGE